MKALIVIDMQYAYFKDANLAAQQATLCMNIQEQINTFNEYGDLIVNAHTLHLPDKSTWTLNMLEDNQGFSFKGHDEAKLLVDFPKNTIDIAKTRDSAFHGTNLAKILQSQNIKEITLAGVSAHTCIFHTAAAAYAHDLVVTLPKGCIGDEDADAMQRAFDYLSKEYRQVIV